MPSSGALHSAICIYLLHTATVAVAGGGRAMDGPTLFIAPHSASYEGLKRGGGHKSESEEIEQGVTTDENKPDAIILIEDDPMKEYMTEKRGGGRTFDIQSRGGARSWALEEEKRGGGRASIDLEKKGGARPMIFPNEKRAGGRGFSVMEEEKRGGGRVFKRGGARAAFYEEEEKRGGGRVFKRGGGRGVYIATGNDQGTTEEKRGGARVFGLEKRGGARVFFDGAKRGGGRSFNEEDKRAGGRSFQKRGGGRVFVQRRFSPWEYGDYSSEDNY